MPVSDIDRLFDEALQPRIVMLQRALAKLGSCVSFMNTGAHPDDETSAMLAALSLRDGLDVSYACSTRGEGGQNEIGTESGRDLALLRTAEMERAAAELDLRLYWLPHGSDERLADFGFSKSGEETLQRWGEAHTLQRFVSVVRSERPDILCPTFLDVPGQHGHHRAMTAAAHRVMQLAGDAAFDTPGLSPWQPKKLYLPAFGGGGTAYDDEIAPPDATLVIEAAGRDPVTGSTYERLGQRSRARHLTQGMGRWVADGEERDWPLHLSDSRVEGPDLQLSSGLPASLGELAQFADAPVLAAPLRDAQAAIDEAVMQSHDPRAVLRAALRATAAVQTALQACPERAAADVVHRLHRKCEQLARVIRLAAGIDVRARLGTQRLRPGDATTLTLERYAGCLPELGGSLEVVPLAAAHARIERRDDGLCYVVDDAAPPSEAFLPRWLPDAPHGARLQVRIAFDGVDSVGELAFETPPLVLPAISVRLSPRRRVLNRVAAPRTVDVRLDDIVPSDGAPSLTLPDGWSAERTDDGFRVSLPDSLEPGEHQLAVSVAGRPASVVSVLSYPHIQPRLRHEPAVLPVHVVDVALPTARVAYVGGGNDRVAEDLSAIGMPVEPLDDARLSSAHPLDGFDTLLVGLFAMRTRTALRAALPRVHAWVERGGHLVTLYHRPWDGWDPDRVPPRRLCIGQPSLRWRVTDERAHVQVLEPEHPLLTTPNRIGEADWQGWHKERGLYFASDWDAAYRPLLSMADPGEAPLQGALLSADIGAGRHVHTSLILHHQMARGVSGAYRLMANLLA